MIFLVILFPFAMDNAYLFKFFNQQIDVLNDFKSHSQKYQAEGHITKAMVVEITTKRKISGVRQKHSKRRVASEQKRARKRAREQTTRP